MAITINAKTSGAGGLETTADNTGNINIQSGGSTVMSISSTGVSVTGSFSQDGAVYSTQPSFRNLIINGDMRIAQRGTSFTGLTTTGYRTVDRYYTSLSSIGTWTQTQSTDAPDGFANSLKMECTTADASPSASDYLIIQHRIEGQNLQHLKKGTANAESLTLSFWVKCNQTGNLQVNLRDFDNSRQIGNTYTINSANTWEKKTITFTGDTTGTLNNDNNASFSLEWWFDSGSNYNSGSVPTSWQTYNDTNRNAGATINLADSTSNYINITGVQLEVGSTATDFEVLPYDVELARCMRYCQVISGALNGNAQCALGYTYNATLGLALYQNFKAQMRALPSLTASGSFIFNEQKSTGYNGISASGIAINQASIDNCNIQCTISGGTSGSPATLAFQNSTSSKLIFSAEL